MVGWPRRGNLSLGPGSAEARWSAKSCRGAEKRWRALRGRCRSQPASFALSVIFAPDKSWDTGQLALAFSANS